MSSEAKERDENAAGAKDLPVGPWDPALDKLREWDPKWAELCFRMSTNPWTHSVLPRKFIELVSVSLNAACTNLNPEGTRHHIRAALEAGATRDEILFVLKCGSVLSIHSCSQAAPIVLEEAKGCQRPVDPARKHRADPGLRCHAQDRTMEHGVGSVLRARSGIY